MSVTSESARPSSSVGRNSALYLLGALFQGAGVFLLQPITLRVLHDDFKWQELFLSISVIQVGVVLATAGLPLEITNSWFEKDNGPKRSRAISGFLSFGGAGLGVVIGLGYIAIANFTGWPPVFGLAIIALGFQASVLSAQAILRAKGQAVRFVALSLMSSMGAYAVGLLVMVIWGPEPFYFMLGYLSGVLVSAMVAWAWTKPSNPWSMPGIVRESLRIGLPVLPHTGALMLMTQGMPFLLAVVAAPGLSGDYGKVQIFVLGTITVLNALNNAWVASIMSSRGEARTAQVSRIARTASWISVILVFLAACAANVVVHLMAQGKETLIPLAQVMPLVAVGYALYLTATTLLFAVRQTWWLAILSPSALVLGILIALFPAVQGNLTLVAVASAVSFVLLGAMYYLVARRYLSGHWPLKDFLFAGLLSVAFVVAAESLPRDLVTGLITLGVGGIVAVAGALVFLARRRKAAAEVTVEDSLRP
ncbi:lipopolysaccharide biosynthesis protein [Arthrobacter sp. NPDC090010]|uniref:lipopolysaccharide biosynthesis protein n=1 Tax=Arthrobacter sp. NPDC090010 TaxID=3363942 RepID=UPI00382F073D